MREADTEGETLQVLLDARLVSERPGGAPTRTISIAPRALGRVSSSVGVRAWLRDAVDQEYVTATIRKAFDEPVAVTYS